MQKRINCNILALLLLFTFVSCREITQTMLIPVVTTQDHMTQYSIGFSTDVSIPHSARIEIIFPYEFDPRGLIQYNGCKLKRQGKKIGDVKCELKFRTFTIHADFIAKQSIIVVIGNVLNPKSVQMSSNFVVKTLFQTVTVVQNQQFGRTPFTPPPINSGSTLDVYNYENTLIGQGSSWVLSFTPSQTYATDSTLRFIFPKGFQSSKIQCNITGISDPALKSRVFPNKHVYDCLNINGRLIGTQKIIVSGVVNPNYEINVDSIEVHILQPNSKVVLQKFTMRTSVQISHKVLNATVTIPNKFRNNTLTYIFELNMDSDLGVGDYIQVSIQGNWTYFLRDSKFIQGINSNQNYAPMFKTNYKWPTKSDLIIKNFSSVARSSQTAFYVSLRTPLASNNYQMTIQTFRSHGGLVEKVQKTIEINETTGFIREMKMHPMVQTIKLPVGKTGPLEITLGLRNNLPQTNVLTYGKFIIKISPNLPLPDVNINGVPKCYFYGDIEAKNCTYDDTDPTKTVITAFTPVDFNFQSSQIPFMVTTEGYSNPLFEGITIDTLVKRYHFHIQFYTDYREEPIPTEVIFGDWVPDEVPMDTFSCDTTTTSERSYDHLICTLTTPSEDLNEPGFVHIFRIQFTGSNPSYYGWDHQLGRSSNHVYSDYPCLGYGDNLVAVPYIKCDLVTWLSGPYASVIFKPYINIYGFQLLPAGSTITLELPGIQRYSVSYGTQLRFSILQDTYGYQTDYITLYSQDYTTSTTSNQATSNDDYDDYNQDISYTLSNSIINKVTDITINSLDLTTTGVTAVIFEVDQNIFEDIGRGHGITCGEHICSKFNKPIQYFIVYPSRTLNRVQSFTFPSIVTPDRPGEYEFRIRIYKSNSYIAHLKFDITIEPETLAPPTYDFHSSLESENDLYPNTAHYFSVGWTTINPLPAGSSFIEVILDNHFTLASDYCVLTTTALSNDGRGIQCEVWTGENKIYLQNLASVPNPTAFKIDLELISTETASSISPTVSISTYYEEDVVVDKVISAPFASASISNTNLKTFSEFDINNPYKIEGGILKGYFGHLLINLKPRTSDGVTKGYFIVLKFTNEFYPYSNQLNLPIICRINNVRQVCTYTLNPFKVTIQDIEGKLTQGSDNLINITTQYLDHNGIHYPAVQGRYLLTAEIINDTMNQTYQYVEQYIDILPEPIKYFNATYAHRDISRHNIFTFQFRNGAEAIPAYNHATTAGRIYIGFPTRSDDNGNVFQDNLGYTTGLGTVIPCWFKSGSDYIAPLTGQKLECRLRTSPYSPKHTVVQIINFKKLDASTNFQVIMAKIMNPASKQIDINFMLQVNTMNAVTHEQYPLYRSYHNMFFNMLSASVTSRSEPDSTTLMFEPGARIGDVNKYFKTIPYSGSGSFSSGDWFIIDMNEQFQLNGDVTGCLSTYYQHCLVFKEINWLAIKIGNTTLLGLEAYITKLPTSISRVDTTYQAFTFKSQRWDETITYKITAANRWMQLRGAITGFKFEVLGSHDKLNINQKNVDVLITFTVSHIVNRGGTIEIKFPNNNGLVPSIKPHCRSAVTLGSALNGDPTGKPATNIQGDIGCMIQNDYSWIITSFDQLAAGRQVKILGTIDFPTHQTASLGMGFVVTYSDTKSNIFTTGRVIDYMTVNFPLEVNNKTWNLDKDATMYRSEALRVGHKGELKFKINLASTLYSYSSGGYIDINTWKYNTMSQSGGFSGPTSNIICKVLRFDNDERYGCEVTAASGSPSNYYYYRIQTNQNLPANQDYEITLTTQNGNANEGIDFPSQTGVYKVQVAVKYSSGNGQQISQPHFVEVYGPDFTVLNFISTIHIPGELNMILVEFKPSNTIATDEQFIIQIPTIGIDGTQMFPVDLGVGYSDYDELQFDLYESDISSMTCKVYIGDKQNHQPVKIICSDFNIAITSSKLVKFGFWTRNPSVSIGLAIPVQVYSYDTYRARKDCWTLLQAGIKILPTTATPISDLGNFASSSPYRQSPNQHLSFTTRNTKALQQNDLYIMKFNFDLRMEQKYAGKFLYNSGLTNTGDVIFMRNSKTVLLRVGANPLALISSGSTTVNARIFSIFYNPVLQLTSAQKTITSFAIYLSSEQSEKILHNDAFPDLVPRQMSNPSFVFVAVRGNIYKGQKQDYKMRFVYSTSSSASDMALVKKISVQFPPYSTYDMKFAGQQCIEDMSSQIEIQDCRIDATTYTIWLTPVQKSTYINSNDFNIETKGYSILNPVNSGSINLNQFVIRYYTWKDDASQPVLFANSEDYVFFKADSSTIPSSTFSFNSRAYSPVHDLVQIPRELYINEYEPASTYLGTTRMKTPLQFVFKVMNTFSDLSSSNNQHLIRITFNSYFSHESINLSTNDLYYNVPTCHLNGFRIHSCSITSGRIEMRFQQSLTTGQQASVRFSVLNTKNDADDGFYLISLSNSIVTLPIEFFPYSKPSYYAEAEPFNTYYRVQTNYPQLGIYEASVTYGTQVYQKLNYLDFLVKFSRNDINGLILEIPVVNTDGTVIYNTPTLMGLESGADYPCSVGINVNVYCYYQKGSSANFGTPTRIYITKFAIQSGNQLSLRMLFTNPDNIGVFPSFTFKAYGGSFSPPQLMGKQYMGSYTIIDPFKTYPDVGYYSTGTCQINPNRGIWSTQTRNLFYIDHSQNAGSYVIVKWELHNGYGQVSQYQYYSPDVVDFFFISTSATDRVVYLVKKLDSYYSGSSSSYHNFGYMRRKHYLDNSYTVYLLKKPGFSQITCSVSLSYVQSYRMVDEYGTISIQYLDIPDRLMSQDCWQYISINTNSLQSLRLFDDDPAELVVAIKFTSNRPFDYFTSDYECSIQAGVTSTDYLKPVTCRLDRSNQQIILQNVNKFLGEQLKLYYKVRTLSYNQQGARVQMRVYANSQSYAVSDGWAIYRSTTTSGYNTFQIQYSQTTHSQKEVVAPVTYLYSQMFNTNWVDSGGYTYINSLSSTRIQVKMRRGSTFVFNTVYKLIFRFWTERLSFNGCQDVTLSGPDSYPPTSYHSCGGSNRYFYVRYIYDYNQYVNVNWPQWDAGQELTLTFTFSSITGDVDNKPDYLYISGTANWFEGHWHLGDQSKCGCDDVRCADNSCCIKTCCDKCWYDVFGTCCKTVCCEYQCCYTYCHTAGSCRWYYNLGTFLLTGRSPFRAPSSSLAQSTSIDYLSAQKSVQTELSLRLNNIYYNAGPSYNSYILFHLHNNVVIPNDNPFPATRDEDLAAYVDCKCVVDSSISISSTTNYQQPKCVRYKPVGMDPSIGIFIDVPVGHSMQCYLPGFLNPSSATNNRMNVDAFLISHHYFHRYIPRSYWSPYLNYNAQRDLTTTGSSSFSPSENGFWSSSREAYQSEYYDVNITGNTLSGPVVYMSMYAPKPLSSFCSSGYYYCRAYTSFINRRYFLIARKSSTTNTFRFSGTTTFPPSDDTLTSYYRTYIAYCDSGNSYYVYHQTYSKTGNVISPSTPTYSYTPSIFGSDLHTTSSGFLLSVDMNGRTLYSFERNYGQFQGSYIKVVMSGFSTLFGCGATLSNRPRSFDNPFFCKVVSSDTLEIRSKQDLDMTGYIYVTLYTSSVPSSVNYRFYLYDKYISSSEYALSTYVSQTFTRTKSGYTIQPTNSIEWRRQTYKEYQVSKGPIRFIINNNYQYVYDYSTTSNSDGFIVYYPGGISSSHNYVCYLKEYEPGKKHLYKEYITACYYQSSDTIRISSIPSHILQPDYNYEVTIYRNNNAAEGLLTSHTSGQLSIRIQTISTTSASSLVNEDIRVVEKYQSVYPIILNSIYLLTRQAAAVNSLFVDFTVNVAGSALHYFEFEFDNLGLSSFEINNGEKIPCAVYGAFSQVSGSSISPNCRGYTNGLDNDSPLIIRVMGFNSFSSGSNFKVSFDDFSNPSYQKLFIVPINLRITYEKRSSADVYTSYFPSIYISDSINRGLASQISGTLSRTNSARGASETQYMDISWPYSSNYGDISQKIVMKIQGGITCCQNYQNFVLDDNRTSSSSLVELWTNKMVNLTVYRTPSLSISSTRLQIRNIINPYPIQKQTYEQLKTIQLLFYSDYQHKYTRLLDQYSYASYQQLSEINVASDFILRDSTNGYDYHQDYPMIYDISYSFTRSSFVGRSLKQTILMFSSGVKSIERAEMRYELSPYIVNPALMVNIFKHSNGNWCLRISGMNENKYSTSYDWIIRMKLFPNGNTLSYVSTTYAENGEIEFTNSASESLSGNNYNGSANAPNTFQLYEQRYIHGYYQLQRSYMYADTGLQTNRLVFRFKTPYNISEVESFDVILQSPSDFVPVTANKELICIIQKTVSERTILGVGLHSECSYSAAANKYTINAPIGGMLESNEYTISILEKNQLNTKFNMPSQPTYREIPFIYNNSLLGLQYGDTYSLDFMGLMKQFSVNHRTKGYSTRNLIGFTFKPRFTLSAASLTAPVTESVLEIQFQSRYFSECLGVEDVFSADGISFKSGAYFSHYSQPSIVNSNTRLLCGQYDKSYTPIKLRVTDYSSFNANSGYYFRFPLILNPSGTNTPFVYKIRLLSYENSQHHPIIKGYYEYNNLEKTVSGSSSSQYTKLDQDNNDYIQRTIGFSLYYYTYQPPINSEVIVKFKNNAVKALTSLATLTSLSNTNYGRYEYYPNINLCVFKKTTNTNDGSLYLGTYPTSIDQQSYTISYMHAYHSTGDTIYTSNFNIGSQDGTQVSGGGVSATLRYLQSWSSSSFTRVSGVSRTNSLGVYTITFKSDELLFPEGSYMVMTIDSEFEIQQDICKGITGFIPGVVNQTSNFVCRKQSSTTLRIAGYSQISAGTELSVTLYLKIIKNSAGNYNPNARIIVYSEENNLILDGQTNSFSLSLWSYGAYDFSLHNYMIRQFQKETSFQFDISFKLSSFTLTSGSYISIDFGNWTIDPAAAAGKAVWKYKVGSNIYWVPSEVTNPSANIYHIPVNANYSMPTGQTIVLRLKHQLPDTLYGIYFPHDQWSYVTIQSYNSADTRLEHQYRRIWIEPYQHTSLTVTPILDYVNAVTMYEFSFMPNISAAGGDTISIEFTTNDDLKDSLYPEDLGRTIETNSSFEVSCHESNHAHIISDETILCQLFLGDKDADPPIPAVLQIPITKDIASGTQIKFTALNLKNPAISNYPIGITAKLLNHCENSDMNNLCTYYKSTKYIQFDTAASIPPFITHGSLSFSPNIVSAVNAEHTFTGSYTVNSGDYVKIIYYPQVPIPDICILTSGNGICYSYPLEKTILIRASTTQTNSYSFSLGGMTNLYQSKVSDLPSTEIWNTVSGSIRAWFQTTSYSVGHITQNPATGDQLSFSFTPTLTPNYQLKYGFNNIVRIQISHLFQNKHVQMIYITTNWQISIANSYCNATLESTTTEAKPYPYRFECIQMSSQSLKLIKQDNFPDWTPDFIDKNVVLYLKYTISDSKTGSSNTWNAHAYTQNIVDSNYRVSQAWGSFVITQFLSPYIYKINFPTQAFSKRTCRTNQLCMFYGYLLPSTLQSEIQINYMTYTIPEEFQYSNLVNYDKCEMEEKNDDFNPIGCTASRSDSDVAINFIPSSYNHKYKLVTIDTSDQDQLFTAPSYPGTHYQMKVDLFSSSSNKLIESMMVNLTTVYGDLLDYTQIYVLIPKDADSIGLFQFKFKLGNDDILPGSENSANNKITSSIEFQFSKSFENDLGTGKQAGEQVACLAVSGLALSITGRLTCKIYPSESTTTYPTIIVTGYDRITKNTDVIIRVVGLKTLSQGDEDYIKIGVSLTYYDYGGVKGYLYEPTGFVVGGTTATSSPIPITLAVSESSSNFVGDLVNYTFTGTIGAGADTVTTTDYVVVQFDENAFEGVFSTNQEAICSLASAGKCNSYGLSKIIYFNPASDISAAALNFNLNNIINSAYSFEYVNLTFKVFTLIDHKVNAIGTSTLLKFSKPSPNISALVTKTDSIYGGDAGIRYFIEFKLNHNLPIYGMISIQVPNAYQSLFKLNSKCVLSSGFTGLSECNIISSHLILIRPNGQLLNPSFSYQIIVTSVTNPNQKLTEHDFIITGYHNNDIYRGQIISRNTFDSPELSITAVKRCQTFEVTLSAYNAFFQSVYSLSLICPSFIKEASEVKLYLSWNPPSKKDRCSSATQSLYSYDCSIGNQFQNTSKFTFMQFFLQQISPQELIAISGKIPNGQMGTYQLTANISYKGFTYLSTKSNKFYITSDSVELIRNSDIKFKHYPINRNYDSIYTLQIPNPNNEATKLMINLPDEISATQGDLICNVLDQGFRENYLNLVVYDNKNSLECNINNNIISIKDISTVLLNLKSQDFLRLSFSRLNNPNVSTTAQQYKLTFINNITGTGAVLSTGTANIPSRISDPPSNLQINSIMLSNNKFIVRSNYTLNLTTVNSGDQMKLNRNSHVGTIITFPNQYLDVLKRLKNPPEVRVKFDNNEYSHSSSMSGLKLITEFDITSPVAFSTVIISFEFVNPKEQLDCSVTPVFKVSIVDFKLNSIIGETLGNNIQCPQFDDRLYVVNITGKGIMAQGTIQEYTISLQKPALFLNITPVLTTSAIEIEPTSIVFRNYLEKVKTFKVKVSQGVAGTFPISFLKEENNQIFYNDIPSQNITTIASTRKYSVWLTNIDAKSVGLPIQLYINLQMENSRQFTIIYAGNCSQEYEFSPSSFMNIPVGTKKIPISVIYKGKTIPQMCIMDFSISSLRTNNYYLKVSRLYLSASRSIDKDSTVALMRLRINQKSTLSTDVGVTVLDKQTSNTKPKFYSLNKTVIEANTADFICSISENGTVYFAVMEMGTNRNKVLQEEMYSQNLATGILYGSSKTFTQGIISTIQATISTEGLASQTTYMIGAYLNSSVGISDIMFEIFHTKKSSNGAAIMIAFTSVYDKQDVISALSKTLRVEEGRLSILTIKQHLVEHQSNYVGELMNTRKYIYDIVLGPNQLDNSQSAIKTLNQLAELDSMQKDLLEFLPNLDISYTITTRQIVLAMPKFRDGGIKIQQVTHQTIKIQVKTWEQSNVSAVVVLIPTQQLLSTQVAQGYDQDNNKVDQQHHASGITDSEGVIELQFSLLKANTEYAIFITAQSVVPYEPRLRINDNKVLRLDTATAKNLNLVGSQETIIETLEQINPELAKSVAEHINNIKNKKVATGDLKTAQYRNGKRVRRTRKST